jgi:hypothetical protein
VRKIDSPCTTMTAYVDDMTGAAWLVRPRAEDDVVFHPLAGSLNYASEVAFVRGLGCEPPYEYDYDEVHDGWTLDGREVVGLFGFDPITSEPTMEELAEALAELRALVPFVPDQRQSPEEDTA